MTAPQKILMIKSHSPGIGDILRSSAGWRALKNRFPEADLYLLLLTKEPGYVSEKLISRHHLLKGFFVVDKRMKEIGGWRVFLDEIEKIVEAVKPDLVIDFDPYGLRTSLICLWLRAKYHVTAVGVNEVPLRGFFYSISSPSHKKFAKERDLFHLQRDKKFRLEYSYRDFVVLSALKIERQAIPIELEETPEGRKFRMEFRKRFGIPEDMGILGVNIGCGTPDALHRRPDLKLLSSLIGHLQKKFGLVVVLTGAQFEKTITEEFIKFHSKKYPGCIYNLAGATDILELPGFLNACNLFVSSDSGPYHIAVALKVPTLALFNYDNKIHYHTHPWVACRVMRTEEDIPSLVRDAEKLLKSVTGPEMAV
ncbi:MAG TPA: glycosyl transferase family 9 [Nitrospiraceae bacterium]|jgi:ADP-heptose:LPS heptosyltransferase|nr:glycosyl transferase family 9 [Nitrospiraceae bacterium]